MNNLATIEQEQFWVGIGASAGGLEAIKSLCQALSNQTNAIYIVAQHLSPKHDSMLTELVQRITEIRVETVEDGMEAVPHVVYVTPPQHDVSVEGNRLRLTRVSDANIPKPSVNNLFTSLAEQKKERAVGIILSGTGSDGAHGIKMIRASGGCTFAQTEETAAYYGMPKSAQDTDCVDFVLAPEQIAEHLNKLSSHVPQNLRLKLEQDEARDRFSELFTIIRRHCGVSFKQYKKATLQRRIERRMIANSMTDFDQYVDLVRRDPEEVVLLYKDILISVTSFFRDREAFLQLEAMLKDILRKRHDQELLRLWVVGCATGEEAYSLAILLAEAVGGPAQLADRNYQIFATDVDSDALGVARRGVYSESSLEDVPQEFKSQYFNKRGDDSYEVIKELKNLVLFSGHNIIDDPPFLRIDLITCRNLLIYFEHELQKKVYSIFHYSLAPSGYLFLGKSESTSQVTDLFRPVRSKERIFQKRSVTSVTPNRYFVTGKTPYYSRISEKQSAESNKVPDLPQTFVEQLGEASVLINDNLDIEHVYGDASVYLRLGRGKPSLNLSEIVIDVFRQDIRPLVFKALRTKTLAKGQERKVGRDGAVYLARAMVYPVALAESAEKFLLVSFQKTSEKVEPAAVADPADSSRINELEDELSMAREHLQTVIEELETSNEELQSMNEELQSSNEELQSSNEELETTNEELQSTNEELVTLNDELNAKSSALEQVTTQLSNIKNSLPFPLVYVDDNGSVIRINEAAKNFFGIGDENRNLFEVVPDDLKGAAIPALVKAAVEVGSTRKSRLERGDRHYWLYVTPYRNSDDLVIGAILSFVDNTDLIRQQEELELSRKKAQEANVAKSEFLANVSHEIRTPLNAIAGVSELLRLQINDATKRDKILDILESSTYSLKSLLDELLDFAKLEAGQVELEATDFSLHKIIAELVEIYSVQASRHEVALISHMDSNLPKRFVGDPLRLQQVIGNLLSNSVKFTERGHIELSVSGQDQGNFHQVVINVRDTGVGMEPEEISHIFDKFTQADSSISRRFGGTGLGLSIVKELVDLMLGEIVVKSEKGVGTEFEVTLPLRESDRAQIDRELIMGSEIPPQQVTDNRILIVEDNRSNIFVLSAFLDEMGLHYDIAESGLEGLEYLRRTSYSIILLDLQMEGMNGFEFFDQLRDYQQTSQQDYQVIAVTAHVQNEIIERCRKAGMHDFLSKPLDMAKLKATLLKHMK